jgi:hypothetical protein
MRGSGLNLTHGVALALVCVSGVAGLATMALCWASRFGLARLTAALAVAAVVVGWAAAQAPRFLPGMTVTQAAAGRSTLVALLIAVICGLVVLIPSLVLLFTLFLRGRLDTPEQHESGEAPVAPPSRAGSGTADLPARLRNRALLSRPIAQTSRSGARSQSGAGADSPSEAGADSPSEAGADSPSGAGAESARGATRRFGAAGVVGLVGGAGLLIFTDSAWTHLLGVAGLLLCAVAVFALTASPLDR